LSHKSGSKSGRILNDTIESNIEADARAFWEKVVGFQNSVGFRFACELNDVTCAYGTDIVQLFWELAA
jgi:hypothetical protein